GSHPWAASSSQGQFGGRLSIEVSGSPSSQCIRSSTAIPRASRVKADLYGNLAHGLSYKHSVALPTVQGCKPLNTSTALRRVYLGPPCNVQTPFGVLSVLESIGLPWLNRMTCFSSPKSASMISSRVAPYGRTFTAMTYGTPRTPYF